MDDKKYTEELTKNIGKKLRGKQTALKFDNTPTEGSVNPVTSEGIKEYVDNHQGLTYTAGENITINNNIINAKDTVYTAGTGIEISEDNQINVDNLVLRTDEYGKLNEKVVVDVNTGYEISNSIYTTQLSGDKLRLYENIENAYAEYAIDGLYYQLNKDTSILDPTINISSYSSDSNSVTRTRINLPLNESTGTTVEYTLATTSEVNEAKNKFLPSTKSILESKLRTWNKKEWIFPESFSFSGFFNSGIWTDGENIYYSEPIYQEATTSYILNKKTSTWEEIIWSLAYETRVRGRDIWSDGKEIYLSTVGQDRGQYQFSKQTRTWVRKNWNGLKPGSGRYIWTDGDNIYYSNGTSQYTLNVSNSTWSSKSWTGLTSFNGYCIWTDGENIYYSEDTNQYILNKNESKWIKKEWGGLTNFSAASGYHRSIWTDGHDIYFNDSYVLNKKTSTWEVKNWELASDVTSISSIWTDGKNIFSSTNAILTKDNPINTPKILSDEINANVEFTQDVPSLNSIEIKGSTFKIEQGDNYSAGTGITITTESDDTKTISVDTNTVAMKTDIPDAVSGTNDGTNWTSLTIGSDTYDIPQGGGNTYNAGQGLNLDSSTNTFNVNDNILKLLELIQLDEDGRTLLRTKTGIQYELAQTWDPDATYYEKTRIEPDTTKLKGTWELNGNPDPFDGTYSWPIHGSFYYLFGNSLENGTQIYKNGTWLQVSPNSAQIYDGANWHLNGIGMPAETTSFQTFLQQGCTKYSDYVLGVDGNTMADIDALSYEYTQVSITEQDFIDNPDTYYIQTSTYATILVEDIITALGNNQ